MATTELNISTLANAQAQPEQTHNDALTHLERLLGRPATNVFTGASPSLTLNNDTFANLDDQSFNGSMFFQLDDDASAPTGTGTLTVPDIERGLFTVYNNSSIPFDVTVSGQTATVPRVSSGAIELLCVSDSNVRKVAEGFVDVPFYFEGTVSANAERRHLFLEDVTAPVALVGSEFDVGTNPSGVTVFDVQENGVSKGGLSVSTGGVVTITGGLATTAEPFTASPRLLQVIAPGATNSIADFTGTLRFLKSV